MEHWKTKEKSELEKAMRNRLRFYLKILQNIVRLNNLMNFKLVKNQPDCLELKLYMKHCLAICGGKVVVAKLLAIYLSDTFLSLTVFFIR